MDNFVTLALKGMAMGIAEVIPGVSGGTLAFITGIYERLLNSIQAVGPSLFVTLKNEGFAAAWKALDGTFLVKLFTGMGIGVIVGIFGVTHLMENYPVLLWAFFFGLIVASAIYIGKQVPKWGGVEIVSLLFAAAVSYYITLASPAQGNESLWFVFISGCIAISALILPGVSGSFMLLLMGMYTIIMPTIKTALSTFDPDSLKLLVVFALGCLTGLMTFSRVLSWTFKNYRSITLAVLTGFMIGSLNKIWPWRQVLSTRVNSKGEEVVFMDKSILPGSFEGEPYIFGVIVLMLVGFVSVFIIEKLGTKPAS